MSDISFRPTVLILHETSGKSFLYVIGNHSVELGVH